VENAYYGTDGKPILAKDAGAARVTSVYDARGNFMESAYFGVDGKPLLAKDIGAARVTSAYDARGNLVENAYFGVDGELSQNAFGFARAKKERDGLGRMLMEKYFDPNRKPVLRANRLMRGDAIEDLFGEWRDLSLSGALDEAAIAKLGSGGFARIEQTFDARGNATRRSFLGLNDEPVAGLNGVSEERVEFDALDRPVLFRPILGIATVTSLGQVATRITYDIQGNIVRIDYVAADGKIINGKNGFASIVIERREGGSGRHLTFKDATGTVSREMQN
jgi:hypothetical protein